MADEFEIHISGIEETIAMLDGASKMIVKHAVGQALTAAAAPVVAALTANTPVDHGYLKAHLMTDIAVDSEGRGGYAQIGYGRKGFVARMLEFGHRKVSHKPKRKELGVYNAKPFMAPSTSASADKAIEAFGGSLAESMGEGIPGVRTA